MGIVHDLKKEHWEQLCRRCGICCLEKSVYPDKVVYDLNAPCQMLDRETGLCTVYENRYEACPRCCPMTPFKAMFAAYLPDQCGYVQWARRHHIRFAVRKQILYQQS